DLKTSAVVPASQGKMGHSIGCVNAGQSSDVGEDFIEKRPQLFRLSKAIGGQRDLQYEKVLRIKPGTHRLHASKTLDHQGGAKQQHKRDGNLRDDEDA